MAFVPAFEDDNSVFEVLSFFLPELDFFVSRTAVATLLVTGKSTPCSLLLLHIYEKKGSGAAVLSYDT